MTDYDYTKKERQAKYRAKMREKGYVLKQFWVHPGDWEKVRKTIERLTRKREKEGEARKSK